MPDPDDKDWSPEDDGAEKDFLKKYTKFLERQIEREDKAEKEREREREARSRQEAVIGRMPGPRTSQYATVASVVSHGPSIRIHAIENGFVFSFSDFLEPKPEHLPPGVSPEAIVGYHKPVEVFVFDHTGAAPILERALKSLRRIKDSGGIYGSDSTMI